MKLVILIFSAILAVCVAQNNVDWAQVRRIHEAPAFFEEFPYLQALFPMYNAVNLNETEGHTSTRNQFNYIVGLVLNTPDSTGFCSGALISTQWIVTAGHCLHRVTTGIAVLGANSIRNNAEVGQTRQALPAGSFFTHAGWNGLRLTDDVGLVRLATVVVPNVNVGIVRLPNIRQVPTTYTNQLATTPGWGRGLFLNATTTVSLLWRQTVVAPSLLCNLQHVGLLESSQFCAAQVPDPALTNHCPNESGSPLVVVEADNNPTLIGISAFTSGLGCNGSRSTIYIRISFYLRWIQEVTGIQIAQDFVF